MDDSNTGRGRPRLAGPAARRRAPAGSDPGHLAAVAQLPAGPRSRPPRPGLVGPACMAGARRTAAVTPRPAADRGGRVPAALAVAYSAAGTGPAFGERGVRTAARPGDAGAARAERGLTRPRLGRAVLARRRASGACAAASTMRACRPRRVRRRGRRRLAGRARVRPERRRFYRSRFAPDPRGRAAAARERGCAWLLACRGCRSSSWCLALLGGGLICLLVINTTLGATSFQIDHLQQAVIRPSLDAAGPAHLQAEIGEQRQPAKIAQEAPQSRHAPPPPRAAA